MNILQAYEWYLLATLALSIVQLRNQVRLYRFVLRAPGRWPRLTSVLRDHLPRVLTWPVLLVAGVMGSLWITHLVLRYVVLPEATVAPEDVTRNVGLLILAIISGLAMVGFDARATFRAASFQPPAKQWLIDLTELGLRAEPTRGPLRFLLDTYVHLKLVERMPLVRRWLRLRTLEIANRVVFGLTLWSAWLL